ncbi:hypothetical protein D3C86_542100 [compost metagenome]
MVAGCCGTATTQGASVIGSSLRSAARRVLKSPPWAGRSNTMKRISCQAVSLGVWLRTVDIVWLKRPRPAHSSPSSGCLGSEAVNHAGAMTGSPPRVQSFWPSQ